MMRSILFAPADSERKLAKVLDAGADAVVLDLEDAVLAPRKAAARARLGAWRGAHAGYANLWVRVNALASGELLRDLAAVVPARPAGIMLPKVSGPEDLTAVGHYLDALEAAHGLDPGSVRIFALVTETPLGVLRLAEIARQRHPRVTHVSWGAEDLSAALGAGEPRLPDGGWRPAYVHARGQCLLTAHAMGVEALDTVYVRYRDLAGLREACLAGRYDGFTGRMAIHPDQIPIIHEAFSPSEAELGLAKRLVEAFASGVGAVSVDGKMYDVPHLRTARRILGLPPGG